MSKCYKCGEQWTNENKVETPLLCPKCSLAEPACSARLRLESVGETIEDAIGNALRLIALLNLRRDNKGASVGGTFGNADGAWTELPNSKTSHTADSQ